MRPNIFDQFANVPLPAITKILQKRKLLDVKDKTPQQRQQELAVQNASLYVLDSLTRRLVVDSNAFSVVALSKLLGKLRIAHKTRAGWLTMGEDHEVLVVVDRIVSDSNFYDSYLLIGQCDELFFLICFISIFLHL
jgi:hypothetical protein